MYSNAYLYFYGIFLLRGEKAPPQITAELFRIYFELEVFKNRLRPEVRRSRARPYEP